MIKKKSPVAVVKRKRSKGLQKMIKPVFNVI